jgi:nucleotide-binding universal stress UspA family protein
MFTTIVVGVDGLPGGRDALALAQRLVDLAGGELVAVHVHPHEPFPLRDLRADVEALAHEEAQALLEGQLAEAGVPARAIATAATSPGRGLHRIADELDADLIVIGSPLGGSADRIVHAAACPVIVVPRGDHEDHAAEHPAAIGVTAR